MLLKMLAQQTAVSAVFFSQLSRGVCQLLGWMCQVAYQGGEEWGGWGRIMAEGAEGREGVLTAWALQLADGRGVARHRGWDGDASD